MKQIRTPIVWPAVFVFVLWEVVAAPMAGGEESKGADLVILGGNVVTMNPQKPQAEAIAVKNQKLVAVGSDEEMKAWIGRQTKQIQLQGEFVMPGFIEGHGHLLGLGQLLGELNLQEAQS